MSAHSAGAGQRSTFEILLPLLAADSVAAHNEPFRAAANMPKQALIVDHNEDAAHSLQPLLELSGYEAKALCDPVAALDAAPEFLLETALLDLGMPQLDGFEVARCIRRVPGLADTVPVALTGCGRDEDRAKSARARFDAHLLKPVDLDALEQLLATQAGRGAAPGHGA